MWKRMEVSDAFTDDIVTDAPASDTAIKFADWVLDNYIAGDSKFPPTLPAKPPDLLFLYTNNGAELYHSHLNDEFYVKHPNIYVFVDVLKMIQQCQRMFQRTACHDSRVSQSTSETRESLWLLHTLSIAHMLSQERNFLRKCVIVMDREPNCDNASTVEIRYRFYLTLTLTFICAFSYRPTSNMGFHRQLMRFYKTPLSLLAKLLAHFLLVTNVYSCNQRHVILTINYCSVWRRLTLIC